MYVSCTCDEGRTSPGQRSEWTRRISQRLKAPLPSREGDGQALMLMWTNKRKPKWVEWTIICCGEGPPMEPSLPALPFASNQGGWVRMGGRVIGREAEEDEGKVCVRERDTHKKTGRERECGGGVQNPIDFTRVLNPNTAVFYICVQPRTKDIYICNIHLNTARGQVRKISGARCKYFIYIYTHTHTHTHTHIYCIYPPHYIWCRLFRAKC